MEQQANRLIYEKSPYLLQHAHNPVDWYPWKEEAFEKAAGENKPIFLSIGYSTCHWCHVMEKESFEDPEVASLMNEVFVSIKVDREERPDLDHVYMAVCQMLTGRGGWPLTIVMMPDKRPFFAGTYIPKESRFGQLGMLELIPRIRELWANRRKEVLDSAAGISRSLGELEKDMPGSDLDMSVLDTAFAELARRFDSTYDGFSMAPKFPSPHNFLFLLRYWKRTGKEEALRMVEKSLQEIRWGGIYDHIGLGVHRYSTDREWLIPHFEKMLYDQAMLSLAYLEAYQTTGNRIYETAAREIFEYVLRDLKSPEGGFYSAEDADSEGVEGKFYLWEEAELKEVLSPEEATLAMK
ncbi:MAG: thioredoxin domain-containing protein, partial [Desulfobacterales bacterium]|nr:thioredoxin domain-containing protein [Desulfobacterales bacterium]